MLVGQGRGFLPSQEPTGGERDDEWGLVFEPVHAKVDFPPHELVDEFLFRDAIVMGHPGKGYLVLEGVEGDAGDPTLLTVALVGQQVNVKHKKHPFDGMPAD